MEDIEGRQSCLQVSTRMRCFANLVLTTEDISKIEERFELNAIESRWIRANGSELIRKQIGVNEIFDSLGIPLFVESLITNHSSLDRKAVAAN